jgi:hypothetical protein
MEEQYTVQTLSPSPHANSFIIGTAVINTHQYQERFWRRRLDGVGLDTVTKEFLAIEFKLTQDARGNYAERAIVLPRISTGVRCSKRSVKSKGGRYNK